MKTRQQAQIRIGMKVASRIFQLASPPPSLPIDPLPLNYSHSVCMEWVADHYQPGKVAQYDDDDSRQEDQHYCYYDSAVPEKVLSAIQMMYAARRRQ